MTGPANTSIVGRKHADNDKLVVVLPVLVASESFQPTIRMAKFAIAMCQAFNSGLDVSYPALCKAVKIDQTLYYKWKQVPGFIQWLQAVQNSFLKSEGLPRVYNAVLKRACGNSPQDAKMFLERFDKDYKPVTGQEHTVTGMRPPDIDPQEAIERSRARTKGLTGQVDDVRTYDRVLGPDEVSQLCKDQAKPIESLPKGPVNQGQGQPIGPVSEQKNNEQEHVQGQ